MLKTLVILCALIWIPVFIYQCAKRPFIVLLIWLFIAPIAVNLIHNPSSNPFFNLPQTEKIQEIPARFRKLMTRNSYLTDPQTFKPQHLREPTRILLSVLFVVFLLDALSRRKRLIPLNTTEIWMGIFSFILIASVLFQSRRLLYGLHTVSDDFVIPFLGYYIARRLVTSEERFRQLTQVIGYLGCYLIVSGLIERLLHSYLLYRVGGPMGSLALPIVMAVVFFMVLLDSAHSWGPISERQALPRGVRWFVLCFSPMIIVLSLQRGNWVAFLFSVVVLMWLGHRLMNRARRWAAIGLILLLASMTIVVLPGLLPKAFVENRISDRGNEEGRYATWLLAIQAGIEHPIFGIGLNNLRDVLGTSSIRFNNVKSFTTVHNSFVSLFAEHGVVGLLSYLVLVGSIIRMGVTLYRHSPHSWEQWAGIAVIAIMIVHLVAAIFSDTLHSFEPLRHLYVYVCIGAIAGLHGQNRAVATFYALPGHSRQIRTGVTAGAPP